MYFKQLDWGGGEWTNKPIAYSYSETEMYVEPAEGSDYWEKTLYEFQHDTGHALLTSWPNETGMEVSFDLNQAFCSLYDQAGLMVWKDAMHWIKIGIEMNDNVPCIAIVATHIYSDWSLAPVPEWNDSNVTFRISKIKDAIIVRARKDDQDWHTYRIIYFPFGEDEGVKAGPMANSPTRSGLQVRFTRWMLTEPDQGLHENPPIQTS